MKSLISITAIIGLLFLFSCNSHDQITDPQTSSEYSLSKQPDGKGKPNVSAAKIDYFTLYINGEPFEIGEDDLPIIDFSENSYEIKYKVTHPDDIADIKLFIFYDVNNDGVWQTQAIETTGYIVDNEEVLSGVEYNLVWDGRVKETSLYHSVYSNDWYIMDQKATYNDGYHPSPSLFADPYGIYVWFQSGSGLIVRESSLLLNTLPADGEMYIESIDMEPITVSKRKSELKVTITLANQVEGAQFSWNWGGNIIGDGYTVSSVSNYSDSNGKIIITSPTYSNTKSGDIIFIVKGVRKQNFVYNPYLHDKSVWEWPATEPYAILSIP